MNIITPEKEILHSETVNFVHLRLADGNPISIYPGHINLIALIQEGPIKYTEGQSDREIFVSDGLLMVHRNVITCYINWANQKKSVYYDQEK